MRKLQIAIVAPSLEILGGQSVQADLLIRAWESDPEVEARLVPINPPLPAPVRWAKRVKYLRTIATECAYVPSVFHEIRHADVVHVFSASYWSFLLAPVPAIAAATLRGRPVVLNYHSGEAPDHLARSAVARAILRRVDRIVVPSRFLVRVFGKFELGATAISNIVDLNRFSYRERFRIAPRILSTRSFEDLYNVACTIRAFRLVQDRYPDASLTLAGGGSREGTLRQLVSDLALKNVTFTGRVPPALIAGLYADHDVYVQSPNIDNMPLSILEAFASGLPVVTTDVGGIPDIVTHRETGLMTTADDHEGLAAHVLELTANPSLARALARAAANTRDRYDWNTVRRHWLNLYRDVVPSRASSERILAPVPERAADGRREGRHS
jgi:glycosyltransferase involved in cell wall biosynthesis